MSRIVRFLNTTIGQKMLMGLTGVLLIGFLLVHMSGNLLVFVSPHTYNEYSHKLVTNPLIYLAELGLLVLFVAHFTSGIRVVLRNRAARPVNYAMREWARGTSHKSISSTTMIWTGLVVLIFVPLHIWMFKFGTWYAADDDPHMRDLFRLVSEDFQSPLLVAWYVLAMVVIGFHLWHGFGSGFESMGVRYKKELRRAGQLLALLIAGGFIVVPVAVFLTGGAL